MNENDIKIPFKIDMEYSYDERLGKINIYFPQGVGRPKVNEVYQNILHMYDVKINDPGKKEDSIDEIKDSEAGKVRETLGFLDGWAKILDSAMGEKKSETEKCMDKLKENGKLLDDIERRVNVLEKKYEKPKIKKDWKPENFKNCFGRFHDWDSGICILCSYKKTCSSTCIDNNARIKVMFKKHEFKTENTPDVEYVDIKKEIKPKCFGSRTCENKYHGGALCTCVSHCFEYSRRNGKKPECFGSDICDEITCPDGIEDECEKELQSKKSKSNVKYSDKPKCFGCESPVAECSSRCVHFEECNIKYNNENTLQ